MILCLNVIALRLYKFVLSSYCVSCTTEGREESQNIELQKETSFSDASKDPSRQGIAHTDEDYDWVRNVASLPLYNAGRGWFRLFDIIPIMPLSMFCKLVGVTFEVSRTNAPTKF